MCNLYTMTAMVDELRKTFGSFDGDREREQACALAVPLPDTDMRRIDALV